MENAKNAITVSTEDNKTQDKFKRVYAPHRRVSVRQCQDCGHYWIMPDSDVIYYVQKYGNIPQRCDACRKRIREENPYPVENQEANTES